MRATSDLIFSINAVFPIIILVLAGYLLKRIGIVSKELAVNLNRLVFKFFLPIMLFMNVYKIESISDIKLGYALYAILATLGIIALAFPFVCIGSKDPAKRGPMLQGTFRSNYAIVGIPLAISLFGEEGGILASVLSAFIVPVYNFLAVISLSIFSKEKNKNIVKSVLLKTLKNPLIQSIALGALFLVIRLVFVKYSVSFRLSNVKFLYDALEKLSSVATPLALVALGAQFEFSQIKELKRQIVFVICLRSVAVPVLGLGIAYLLGCFSSAHFAAFIAVFSTPIAVSSVPMAQEMGSDYSLAGQLVVWTTIASAFTLFISTYILRLVGIF